MPLQKIKSGRVLSVSSSEWLAPVGTIFYDEELGDLRLGDGVTPGGILLSVGYDDSVTQAWTWQKSGGAWGAYTTADRANADTYVRVTPISLADNIKVRAVIREY